MARIVFAMIDDIDCPTGGVKVIYQAVAALRRAGLDACIIGDRPPVWLRDPVAAYTDRLQRGDVFVAPEVTAQRYADVLLKKDPDRRVVWFQNHNALTMRPEFDWQRFRHLRCLTVSDFSRRQLERAGFDHVTVVPPGVDLSVFQPASKRSAIAYMPRKWPDLAGRLRSRFSAVDWVPIDGRTESDTAAVLASASVFLSLCRGEGFGLPPVEAMASGCLVCGFAGEGMTDYATSDNGIWCREGHESACVEAIAKVLEVDPAPYLAAGMQTAERYALPVFDERIVAYFQDILSS